MEKQVGNFLFKETSIKGVYIIEPKKYGDNRGYFMETYKKKDFDEAGLVYNFIQDNQSKSKKGVLRGLHFQKTYPQAKLVRCIEGEVFDVCVDLRKGSPTYGKWEGVVLSAEKGNQFMIPRGFAHGFVVLRFPCERLGVGYRRCRLGSMAGRIVYVSQGCPMFCIL